MPYEETHAVDFKAIRLKVASPEDIRRWSYGEVTKPETINYRTQKPEKSGLFAEEIFGPSKDWECFCGKYKRIRYKGIICDKCGVEVTRSVVRRERMGHINLSAPVSHIWFLRGVPSKIGLMLDMGVQDLEKVIYFANFIITRVNEDLRAETLQQLDNEFQAKKKQIDAEFHQQQNNLKQQLNAAKESEATKLNKELENLAQAKAEKLKLLDEAVDMARKELKNLAPLQILTEQSYQDLSLKYGHVFEASIGAEAIHHLLSEIDLDKLIKHLEKEAADATEAKTRRVVRRLRLAKNLKANSIRPEWMIMTAIPIIPPDLRPMVQLDGGRFATSDLNDLYRRVINRNNRLKRLLELNAPEVIVRNEKRMLQEAVDALIDNGARHGKTVTASTGQKRMLRSIADMLKGKQGRFRQNLLGKRVDYSGRSVIVIGPYLRLDQCGLPKRMALELFRPFVISQLIKRELVHNVRSAGRYIEAGHEEVWDILEEVTRHATVLLNRAPTLHRLGIQAFRPILIEGKAIQIHPMVCSAFNADFDGDQMAVHVPLTEQAKWESENLMMSTKNLLKPATGTPVVSPNMDIVLGCYYMTQLSDKQSLIFSSPDEAIIGYESGQISLQNEVTIRINGERLSTSVGRILFNRILPTEFGFVNESMDKKALSSLVSRSFAELGQDRTVELLDAIKNFGFKHVTQSGISWGMSDLEVPEKKAGIIREAEQKIREIHEAYEAGLLTDNERYIRVINAWTSAKEEVQVASKDALNKLGPVYMMINSGARGSWAQTTQMMGMKGLVGNPSGKTMELPVKASFKEGFDVLEYFISTHGARKGLTDTALKTANAGYLTRRLVDVSQDVVINLADCGDTAGFVITKQESEDMGYDIYQRITGRVLAAELVDDKGKVLAKAGTLIDPMTLVKLKKASISSATIRSVMSCKATRGICQQCYGYDLARSELVKLGTAVGIIAAQSIGEPGTQLTMRTFHTGGVAGGQDITQGLPRVEELFEARPVKSPALIAAVAGQVKVENAGDHRVLKILHQATGHDRYDLPKARAKNKADVKVSDGQSVVVGDLLMAIGEKQVTAERDGRVKLTPTAIFVEFEEQSSTDADVPGNIALIVKDGDLVDAGTILTEGSINLQELFALQGRQAVQKYVIKEIQFIYSSQGQYLNDKHIEIIVRQMFSRVYVKTSGDSELVAGEIVDRAIVDDITVALKKAKKTPPEVEPLLLGVTKASLTTESWLSAASFQETARVLIDAAVSGKIDPLRGLKENVIIGKPIPAGTGFENRKKQLAEAAAAIADA
ncbi:MAG: DNA-directed RNA polymerase subunit beta' [Candidatus Kerfeldbacteria bacterium]|nr:DNA-directed RNA polymerase subunit beta' [Candidatus Kerfeldbacteria bacterium]